MRRVVIESPYAGDVEGNVAYARAALRDCLLRGNAPIASHLLHTQVFDDLNPAERATGIAAGQAWIEVCDMVVAYVERGISPGMRTAFTVAKMHGKPIEFRAVGNPYQASALMLGKWGVRTGPKSVHEAILDLAYEAAPQEDLEQAHAYALAAMIVTKDRADEAFAAMKAAQSMMFNPGITPLLREWIGA